MSDKLEISIKEVEVTKLNLQTDDVLMVTVKNNEITQSNLESLRNGLRSIFPKNEVMVLCLSNDDEVRFTVTKQVQSSCGTQSYCSDCNCGKKEQAEKQ